MTMQHLSPETACRALRVVCPAPTVRPMLAIAGLLLTACTGDDESVPSGVTPNLLTYEREAPAQTGPINGVAQSLAELTVIVENQRQRIARQSAALAELGDAGEMRGRSIAGLKKEQLAAEAQRAENRRALESEIARLRNRIDGLESRLETMSEAIDKAASTASEAQVTANRSSAAQMADSGDPVAGEIAAGQSYGLHLASYRTAASAQDGWGDLQESHGDVLSGLEMRLAQLDLDSLGGQYLRLLAGPYASVDAARDACAQLRPRDQFCQVTVYRDGGTESGNE